MVQQMLERMSNDVDASTARNATEDFVAHLVVPGGMDGGAFAEQTNAWLPLSQRLFDSSPFADFLAQPALTSGLVVVSTIVGAIGLAKIVAHTSGPVLVLPRIERRSRVIVHDEIELLLADDLSPDAARVIAAAEAVTGGLARPSEFLHLHVVPERGDHQRFGERLLDDGHRRVEAQLEARGARLKELVEAKGGVYFAEIWEGDVAHEIERAARGRAKHLSIVGRHRAFHWRNFSFGRLPYDAMVAMPGAILLAP